MFLFRDILAFRNRAFALPLLVLTLACGAHSQTLEGDWKGTLSVPSGDIPCIFHLDANGGGTLTAQSTAPLQYSVNGSQVTITVSSINGTYNATVNGNQMTGTWSQNNQDAPLTVTKGGATGQNGAGEGSGRGGAGGSGTGGSSTVALQGDWKGILNGNIRCVFHLDANGGGTLTAQSTAPLQYSVNGSQVTITVSSINGTYNATVNGNRMTGTWSQNNQEAPLTVTK